MASALSFPNSLTLEAGAETLDLSLQMTDLIPSSKNTEQGESG